MTFSATDYAEDTDLERFVLDRLGTHRIRFAEPTAIHDVRGRVGGVGGAVHVKVGAATTGLGARDDEAAALLDAYLERANTKARLALVVNSSTE